MSHNIIREDKTCLNCRHVVQGRFCPNCGQENIENRKTFHQLFVHFFEDLTHYENAFWRTIKNLLLKPASLTKEYLSGKRLSYLAPVRLYIFISFITFFFITVIPNTDKNVNNDKNVKALEANTVEKTAKDLPDKSVTTDSQANIPFKEKNSKDKYDELFSLGYHSIHELDSLQKYGPIDERLDAVSYWIVKKTLQVKENNSNEEIKYKFKTSFARNFSKTLIFYMPLFAFFLWLFHNKKRWYYFDHGIFTLHYFSFLLLITLIVFLYDKLFSLFENSAIAETLQNIIDFGALAWMFYYFFPAHHRFYGETRWVSFFKSMLLFIINIFLIIIIITLFALYTFINIK